MLWAFRNASASFIVFMCLFGFAVVNTNGQRNYVIELNKSKCYHNSSLIKCLECSLRNDSDHQYLIDARLEWTTPIPELYVRTIMHFSRNNMPRMTLFDLTMNGCEFLVTIHKHKMMSVFARALEKYMNVIPRCPFAKDFNYTVTGLHYNVQDFPTYIPEVDFKVTNIFLYQNQDQGKAIFWGRVVHLKGGQIQGRDLS